MTAWNDQSLDLLDDLIRRLEQAWQAGGEADLGQFVPPVGHPARQRALLALILTDQELRWQRGQHKTIEEYLAAWPELREQPECVAELTSAEEQLQATVGMPASTITGSTAATLDATPPAQSQAITIRCPHCHQDVEILGHTSSDELTCPSCGSSFRLAEGKVTAVISSAKAVAPPAPRRIAHFQLLERLGEGAFGTVWKARDSQLDKLVAVKIPRTACLGPEESERFLREARAAAQLHHPNIVGVQAAGRDGEQLYIVSELIDGLPLSQWKTGRKLSYQESAALCATLAEALHYAHQRQVIHRDLKPQNILMAAAGQPHLTDFGLAKREAGEATMTIEGQILGTPAYLSPEQAGGRSHEADGRSDIYSLGVILFELLTGQLPFQGTLSTLLKRHAEEDAPRLRQRDARIPRDLETICLKCLEKAPRQRYQTAEELGAELQRFLNHEPILARPIGRPARLWRWCRRQPVVAGFFAVSAVAVLALLLAWSVGRQAERTRRVAGYNRAFDAALQSPILSEDYLRQMDARILEMQSVDAASAGAAQRRLQDRFAVAVAAGIDQPRLRQEDVERLRSALHLLAARDSAAAQSLEQRLLLRERAWQPVFDLRPPFAAVAEVFEPQAVERRDTRLAAVAPIRTTEYTPLEGRPTLAVDQVITTRFPCGVNAQWEAAFDSSWPRAERLGLLLNATGGGGYAFVLRPSTATAAKPQGKTGQPAQLPIPFADDAPTHLGYRAEIYKNNVLLQYLELPGQDLPTGSLTLRATREDERLRFQVNSLGPVEVRDIFPLPAGQQSVFAIDWPRAVELLHCQAWEKTQPLKPSPLEDGDRCSESRQFPEALQSYREQAAATGDREIGQEARYKQAICLIALERQSEAEDVLQALFQEPGDRWPPLAGFQLWLSRLQRQRFDEADGIQRVLTSRGNIADVAATLPSYVRDGILQCYFDGAGFGSLDRVLRFNPDRLVNMEAVARIDRLLSPDGRGRIWHQLQLAQAYRFAGRDDKALPILEGLVRRYPNTTVFIMNYVRSLRLAGRHREALEYVSQAIHRLRERLAGGEWPDTEWLELFIQRARVRAALEDWSGAEGETAELLQMAERPDIVAEVGETLPPTLCRAYLLQGFLYQRRGDEPAALEAWQKGYAAIQSVLQSPKPTDITTVNALILGSLSGDLTWEDAQGFLRKFSGDAEQNPFAIATTAVASPATVHGVLQNMWRTPRGRRAAEAIAFETLPTSQRVSVPVQLTMAEYFRQGAFGGDLAGEQEELVWRTCECIYDKLCTSGGLAGPQLIQLALTWKGTTNFLGWSGVAPTLPATFRGPFAYLLGHRFLRLDNKPQALTFFQTALQDAEAGSPLARLAKEDLELAQAGQGRLFVAGSPDGEVHVQVKQNGTLVTMLTAASAAQADLPAGAYQLSIETSSSDATSRQQDVSLLVGGRKYIQVGE